MADSPSIIPGMADAAVNPAEGRSAGRAVLGAAIALVAAGGAAFWWGDAGRPAPGGLAMFFDFPAQPPVLVTDGPTQPPAELAPLVPLVPRSEPKPAPPTFTAPAPAPAPTVPPPPAPTAPRAQRPQQPNLFDPPAAHGPDLSIPAWRRVAEAAERSDPAAAIVMIEDFRHQHSGDYQPALDALAERALDRLWWQRIGELLQTRQRLAPQIARIRQEMARSTSPQRQRELADQLKTLQAQADAATRDLQDMRYTSSSPPDPSNARLMGQLRDQRDPMVYGYWRVRTMSTIIRTRGLAPWQVN